MKLQFMELLVIIVDISVVVHLANKQTEVTKGTEEPKMPNEDLTPNVIRDILEEVRPLDPNKPINKQPEIRQARIHAFLNMLCICPPYGCGNPIGNYPFRDRLSLKEYAISGLCQRCQDRIFQAPESD